MGWFAKVGTIWYYVLQRENKKKTCTKFVLATRFFITKKGKKTLVIILRSQGEGH